MSMLGALIFFAVACSTTLAIHDASVDTVHDSPFQNLAAASRDASDIFPPRMVHGRKLSAAAYGMKTTTTNLKADELGGEAASDAACCSAGAAATYCFMRSVTGYAQYKKVGSKSDWASLGLWVIGDVGCVAHGSDVTVFVIEGNNQRLVSNTIRAGRLLGRKNSDAYNLQEVPGCVATGKDFACMFRGVYGLSFYITHIKGTWGPPITQGGVLYSPIGLYYSDSTKELNAYATSKNYHIQIYTKTAAGVVTYWKEEGIFVMSGRPSICSHGRNTIDIFTLGPGNNLLWLRRDASGKYQGWMNEEGRIIYPPTCLGITNRIDCFSVSPDFYLSKKVWRGSSWTRWEKIVWGYMGQPSCHFVAGSTSSISCYVRSIETAGIDVFTFHA